MHEAMVAQSLLNAILEEAEKEHARPARAMISCGALEAINDEVLDFAFQAIAKDTACEGMELKIEHKAIQAKCRDCEAIFEFDVIEQKCPKCGCSQFDILPDAPLLLENIEFETE